jgi:hypothetical protein
LRRVEAREHVQEDHPRKSLLLNDLQQHELAGPDRIKQE